MGWNDFRVSLLPVGRVLRTEHDPNARTWSGGPVEVQDTMATEGPTRRPIEARSVEDRLASEGFAITQKGDAFVRMDGAGVECFLCVEANHLREVILTFTLDRRSQPHLASWFHLIDTLTKAGEFQLFNRETQESMVARDFARMLVESRAWKGLTPGWDWPAPSQALDGSQAEKPRPRREFAEVDNDLAAEMIAIVEEGWRIGEAA